jgi:hypothetical protein
MTISGAAVDPNMPLQSPAQRALLTILNARLGWWMENPQMSGEWRARSPTFGVLGSLSRELLGLTDEKGEYIHLTDGGHFDNSGVYELVRRRCRFIVAVDAAEDINDSSENLAAMIRLVRADFGIRIEIDTSPLRTDEKGLSRWHVAMGVVRYDDVDEDAAAGTFVFIRSSLTGDEPADLRNYAAVDPRFPHHTTAGNQFFDEVQFESYRALGEHLAGSVFGEAAADFDVNGLSRATHTTEVRRFFAVVRNRWFPPPPDFNRNYIEAGKACADLIQSLRGTGGSGDNLTRQIYPEMTKLKSGSSADSITPSEILAINNMLDVMEMAWISIDLNSYYAHPMHSGWMGTCRRWASSETFQKCWPVLRGEYSKEFVRFCERVLNLPPIGISPQRLDLKTFPNETSWSKPIESLNNEFGREWAEILSDALDFEEERYKNAQKRQEASRTRSGVPQGGGFSSNPDRGVAALPCPPVPIPADLMAAIRLEYEMADGLRVDPLVWLLKVATPRKEISKIGSQRSRIALPELDEFAVGVLVVYQPKSREEAKSDCYEVIFWIRGPYRSLGFGRKAIDYQIIHDGKLVTIHETIRLELAQRIMTQSNNVLKPTRIIARYPILGDTSADRLQRALWMNFFYDYDFRRSKSDRNDRFLTLQYVIDEEGIAELKRRINARTN